MKEEAQVIYAASRPITALDMLELPNGSRASDVCDIYTAIGVNTNAVPGCECVLPRPTSSSPGRDRFMVQRPDADGGTIALFNHIGDFVPYPNLAWFVETAPLF